MKSSLIKKCNKIKLVMTDVDGVLTDGGMYYSQNGDVMKKFYSRDGMGVTLLREIDIPTIIVTKEQTMMVKKWAKKMKIRKLLDGINNKEFVLKKICKEFKIKLGGGVLNDAGCYPVCASRILFESEPIGVLSKLFFKKNIDVDLKFSGMLVYSNNRISSMHVGYGLFFQSMYEIWGEHGKISTNRAYNIPPNEKPIVSKFKKIEKKIYINPADHFQLMIDSFSQEILGKKQSIYNFEEDLLKQAKVMDALRISNKEQRYVKLDELSSD